ncbi:hypothetical protein QE152_g1378 [Popillia japonica]|uniref:Uncharacterized protein n=1 Tax=Popillia japonica TaxID=7064 RepID=A0AAW1N513_POPJA
MGGADLMEKKKKHISVPRPDIVLQCNQNMGGADLRDSNVSCYCIGIRPKKCWKTVRNRKFSTLANCQIRCYFKIHSGG